MTNNQNRKTEAPVPGKYEQAALERLALIDAELLVDDLAELVVADARARDRAEAVHDRRQAAQDAFEAAMSDPAASPDDLRRLADDAGSWGRLAAVTVVPDGPLVVPVDVAVRAGHRLVTAVMSGPAMVPRQPAYLAERAAFENLPSMFVHLNALKPPAITAAELAAVAGFESADEAVRQWEAGVAVVGDLLSRAATGDVAVDVVSTLVSASGYRASRADLVAVVAAANSVTEAADAERAQLGLTWRAPAQ